jgi:CO/xanthine dehydrogenase Mo-binding subunit
MAAVPAAPATRIDGVEKVTGEATYAADVRRPGLLQGKVLRSPHAHARIVHIDTSRARALPGVAAVLSGGDLPDYRVGRSMRDMPVLAVEKVRFIGEKVAAVAAETAEIAEEAIALIEVEYEELPAVFDPMDAKAPGAPLVHDPAWVLAHKTPEQRPADYPNSVSNPVSGASVDEIEAALAGADYVFEHTFHTPIQHQAYLEPHSCLVEIDERDVAHIWASNKAPFLLLNYLREGIGLQRDQVELHLLPLGGDFGGKGSFMDIPLVYLLAKASGRPVQMTMSYAEELIAGNPRHSAVVWVKSGFSRDGRLVARWMRAFYNSGAYAAFKPGPAATVGGGRGALGAYDIPVSRGEVHMIYTNTVPCGHMRAPGRAQAVHAAECHMDLCARELGIDPLELRLTNAPRQARTRRDGEVGSTPRADEALRESARAIGWAEPRPQGVGKGIALVEIGSGQGSYAAEMIVERSGDVVLHTPIIEHGAGMLTVFRQMIGEALGLPLERVRIEQTTENFEYDRGVGGSRTTRIVGRMIDLLAERVQRRLAEHVAAEFGFEADQVTAEGGGFRTPDGRFHTLADAASLASENLHELLAYDADRFDGVRAYAAIAAEVEVDAETGLVQVRRIANAYEVGRIINPILHQGQIDGGLMQGLGYALAEGLRLEDGRVTTANLGDYKIPCTADAPPLETTLLAPDLTLGITPIGEGPNCAISAAIVNAIVDVVGRQVEIPVVSEALVAAPGR